MRNAIALIAAIISFASILPYIRDVNKGNTHPNMVSWLTWCMLNMINTVAALSVGSNGASKWGVCSSHRFRHTACPAPRCKQIFCFRYCMSGTRSRGNRRMEANRSTSSRGPDRGMYRFSRSPAHMAARLDRAVCRNVARICDRRRDGCRDALYNCKLQLRIASVPVPGRH